MSDSTPKDTGFLHLAQAAAGFLARGAARFDSWRNVVTGQGTARDKSTYTEMELELLSEEQLSTLYRCSPLHRRTVRLLPDECFRAGFEVRVPGDAALAQSINSQLADLKAEERLWEAHYKARKYGGALVVIGMSNAGKPAELFDVERDSLDAVTHLNVFSSREAWAREYYAELGRKDFGEVATYQLSPLIGGYSAGWDVVHASRTLRFDGVRIERDEMQGQQGWGDSVLQAVHTAIRDWASGYGGAAGLLHDAAQGVYKLPELTKLLLQNRLDVVQNKMALLDMAKSNQRALLLGEGESYERLATQFSGIEGVLIRLDFMLSAAIGYPVTILLGQAPAGLNATGSADLETFRAAAQAEQRREVKPQLEKLVKLLFRAKRGPSGGVEPEHWSIHFRPLSQPTTKEVADTRLVHAQTDEVRIRSGVITPAVAATRLTGDEYSDEVQVDESLLEPLPGEGQEEVEAPTSEVQQVQPVGTPGAEPDKVSDKALNGAQVEAALGIVDRVASRTLPRETGVGMLMEFFTLGREQAERIMGEVGRGFFAQPAAPSAPAAPARADARPKRKVKAKPAGGE